MIARLLAPRGLLFGRRGQRAGYVCVTGSRRGQRPPRRTVAANHSLLLGLFRAPGPRAVVRPTRVCSTHACNSYALRPFYAPPPLQVVRGRLLDARAAGRGAAGAPECSAPRERVGPPQLSRARAGHRRPAAREVQHYIRVCSLVLFRTRHEDWCAPNDREGRTVAFVRGIGRPPLIRWLVSRQLVAPLVPVNLAFLALTLLVCAHRL